MLRKLLTVFLLAAFCVTLVPTAALAARIEQTPLEKTATVEKILYGSEQEGSLVERVGKLEKDLFGLPGKEALMAKVERIYVYVRESSSAAPSLAFKIASLEWSLTQNVSKGPVKNRLESLERTVSGLVGTGAIDGRVSRLMSLTFSGAKLQASQVTLNKDTLIKIKTVTPLDSKKNMTGETVEFEAADDVYAAGMLVIAKGARGIGKIVKAEAAQNFGRDAKMEVSFDSIESLDMTTIPTVLGDKAKEETKSLAKAAGAGVVGVILLGPIGVVGAAFVKGNNITVPAGTQLYIQTQTDVEVVGMIAK